MAEHACLCVCTCVQGWFWMSSITYFFETVPLSKPGAQWLMMLAGQWMPKKCLSLSLPTTTQGLKSSTALSFSCGSWNSKLRSSCLWNKLNETSPSPVIPILRVLQVIGCPLGDRGCPSGDGSTTRVWELLTSAIEPECLLSEIYAKDEGRKPLAHHWVLGWLSGSRLEPGICQHILYP